MARKTKAEREQEALKEKEQRVAEYTKNYPAELMRALEDVSMYMLCSTIKVVEGEFDVTLGGSAKHFRLPYLIANTDYFDELEHLKGRIDQEKERQKEYRTRQIKIDAALSKLTSEEIALLGLE